jgi:hypothetical protein
MVARLPMPLCESPHTSHREMIPRLLNLVNCIGARAGPIVRVRSQAEVKVDPRHVRFSNRPIGVKRFQTFHQHSVDVARGLALLFGIGIRALPSWDSRTRRNNLYRGLAVLQTAGPSGHANSPQPSSRKGHHSSARWSSSVLLSCLICVALMLLRFPGSIGTRCRQPRCGAGSRPAGAPAPRPLS